MMMAQCVEMELSAPIPVPGPSTSNFGSTSVQNRPSRCVTPKPDFGPRRYFDQSFFSLGKGNNRYGSDRIRNNHPISLCSELFPMIDTPISPPPEDKGPSYDSSPNYTVYAELQQSLDTITNYFQGLEINGNGPLANCSDCVICGKSTMQLQREAVSDYLVKTSIPGEMSLQVEACKRAFIEGMQVRTLLLLPDGWRL